MKKAKSSVAPFLLGSALMLGFILSLPLICRAALFLWGQ